MNPLLVRNKKTGEIWEIRNRRTWPYSGIELELQITRVLSTRDWEFLKPTKYWELTE